MPNTYPNWDELRIDPFSTFELIDCKDDEEVRRHYRDWLLGGEHFEWRFWKDKISGEFVLQRR